MRNSISIYEECLLGDSFKVRDNTFYKIITFLLYYKILIKLAEENLSEYIQNFLLKLYSKYKTMNDERLRELIKEVAEGSEVAFSCLYEELWKRVYLFIHSILQKEEASKDATAETFVEVWKSAKKFKGRSNVITWILGIARNICLKHLKNFDLSESESIGEIPEPWTSHADLHERAFNRALFKNAFKKLSPAHREIINLVFYQGLSYREIAELLHLPINTVKTRVFYAKKQLKEILKQMGVSRDDL